MQRNVTEQKELKEGNKKFEIPIHEEVSFKDIAKYLDGQMQDSIKKQLEGIDEEVENLGKVCDNIYKKSYEEYKSILDKERKDLDNDVKQYISNLKDNLIGLRNRINYDYKGKYREINTKLNKLVEELKSSTKKSVKLQYKIDNLKEDCSFYEKQIDSMKDMNLYLKYKLKLFLGDIEDDEESKSKESQNNEINKDINNNNNINNNSNEYIGNNNLDNKNVIQKNNNDDKTTDKEEGVNDDDDKLYITATKNLYNSSKNKTKNEFDEVGYLNSKLDLEELQLLNYIHHEKEKNSKLSNIYNTLFLKTKNQYFSYLNDLIDEQKTINTSKSLEKNYFNESSLTNNNLFLPSIYNTSLTISNSEAYNKRKNFYTSENPGPGYISRKGNKEIILTFLEDLEVKKAIYKLMYGETK